MAYRYSWTKVAQMVVTRQADQCAKRWQHYLNPCLDHSEWSSEDEERLLEAVDQYGKNWKKISEDVFPGRSANNVKNRHARLVRHRQTSPRSSKTVDINLPDAPQPQPLAPNASEAPKSDHYDLDDFEPQTKDEYFMNPSSLDNQYSLPQSTLPLTTDTQMLHNFTNTCAESIYPMTALTPPMATPDLSFMLNEEAFCDTLPMVDSESVSGTINPSNQSSINLFDGCHSQDNMTCFSANGNPKLITPPHGSSYSSTTNTPHVVQSPISVSPSSPTQELTPPTETIPTKTEVDSTTVLQADGGLSGDTISSRRRTLVLQDVNPQLFGRIVTLLMDEGSGLRIASI
ncbi:MAG: hypothetical protein Q9160_007921 [Pyrenula sp. 1 TL-2023]